MTQKPSIIIRHRNFYGRKKGKNFSNVHKTRLATQLQYLSLKGVSLTENPKRCSIDLRDTFAETNVWLEIGFGSGEHLVHQAKKYPEVGFLGCEPYLSGVAKTIKNINEMGLSNIRIYAGDVRDLFDVLKTASIAKAFLLYPDPWPKKRHRKRRFINPDYLIPLARIMKDTSEFRITTDSADYAAQAIESVPCVGFQILSTSKNCVPDDWKDWISTRYEQKALKVGGHTHYLTFLRNYYTAS